MKPALKVVQGYRPTPEDKMRETQMLNALTMCSMSTKRETKRKWFQRYAELHNQRSSEYVVWMEREKGLNRG